ncbi:hypothetical protein ACO0SA_004594 [Hanseniaspora valbyensis]
MTEDSMENKNNSVVFNNSTNTPSLSQTKTQFNSKITTGYIESESELYTTTDDDDCDEDINNNDVDYDTAPNGRNSPKTPETDNLEMLLNDDTLESMTLKKRVKVYFLENGDWRDIGTGYVSGVKKLPEEEEVTEETNNNQEDKETEVIPYLLVVDENSPEQSIIMSRLEGEIEYQRQEETLIVWRDTSGKDMALSFEEIGGCDHICDFIKYIQNNLVPTISLIAIRGDLNNMDPDNNNFNNTNNVAELLAGPVALPTIKDDLSASELIESLKIINDNLYQSFLKVSTQKFILDKDYLNCLVTNFEVNSKRNDWQKLILISSILKSIMAYNEAYIVYRILENDLFENCLAILEYDLDTPTMRANYIELYKSFKEQATLKQEVWFNHETLKDLENNKNNTGSNHDMQDEDGSTDQSISEEFNESENCKFLVGQLARLTFLKDFVFARYLDDYPIIQEVLQDDQIQLLEFITKKLNILNKLVNNILNAGNDVETIIQNLKMLHECILMAKTALGNNTDESAEFMQKLVDVKIFEMLKFVFSGIPETAPENDSLYEELKTVTTEIALAIIENDIMSLKDESGSISSLSAAFLIDKKESECKNEDQIALNEEDHNNTNNTTTREQSSEPIKIDLSLISVLSNLLTKDNCQYLKPQVLHALLALLNIEGSTGVEDFLTQSISKIEYKITEIVDDESDFYSDEEEEEEDYMMNPEDSNPNIKLMGKSGALSMFMKQLNHAEDAFDEDYDDLEEQELEEEDREEEEDDDEDDDDDLDEEEEDIIVDEEDEKFYERELMGIAEEPLSKNATKKINSLNNDNTSEDLDYDMENSDEENLNKKITNEEGEDEDDDFDLDNFVAHFDQLEEGDDQYSNDLDTQRGLYGDSLGFPTDTRDKFLKQFYQNIAPSLLDSVIKLNTSTYRNNNLIHLFDVIKFMIADHIKISKIFILIENGQILSNIAQIIESTDSTLRIKIKCMKLLTAIVSLDDTDYITHIVNENLLDSTFSIFKQYGKSNSIIKSIILEFCKLLTDMSEDKFNDISQQNFAIIGEYVFNRYMDCILDVTRDKEYTVLKRYADIMKAFREEKQSKANAITEIRNKSFIKQIEDEPIDDVLV